MKSIALDAAVLFIVFNRPKTTSQVFQAIRAAKPRRLYVAADGSRQDRPREKEIVREVQEIATRVDWPCELKVLFRDENLGCKYAVSGAIDWFFKSEEQGIILEDDCLPSKSFFNYCNDCLVKYKHDKRVWDIAGSNSLSEFPTVGASSYSYSSYGEIWGWATWRDRWETFDLELANAQSNGSIPLVLNSLQDWEYPEVRRRQFEQILDGFNTWDYQWLFNRLSNSGISIVPAKNMISNIGFGSDATHTTDNSEFANRDRHDIEFPLVSPPNLVRNRNRDKEILRRAFAHHRATLTQKVITRIRNRITSK